MRIIKERQIAILVHLFINMIGSRKPRKVSGKGHRNIVKEWFQQYLEKYLALTY